MIYNIRVRKRVKYMRIYAIKKRLGSKENIATRLFMRLLEKKTGAGEV